MPLGILRTRLVLTSFDVIISLYKWNSCLVYLDDFIVFSADPAQQIKNVYFALTALKQAEFYLKIYKCQFLKKSETMTPKSSAEIDRCRSSRDQVITRGKNAGDADTTEDLPRIHEHLPPFNTVVQKYFVNDEQLAKIFEGQETAATDRGAYFCFQISYQSFL